MYEHLGLAAVFIALAVAGGLGDRGLSSQIPPGSITLTSR